jgi:hypothetical protein
MNGVPGFGGGTISGNVGRLGAHQWILSLGWNCESNGGARGLRGAAHKGCFQSQVHGSGKPVVEATGSTLTTAKDVERKAQSAYIYETAFGENALEKT